ncbi:MAG: isochorismatase family protein [Candidatus Omnitrophica bacterium]|nr:isochorismatase family protein [Candidatus Omnitrophota bacterium]
MKRIVFMDVDTQYDFMSPKGALYVKGARLIVARLKRLTALADRCRIPIVSSMDTHRANDPEFKMFPAHCLPASRGHRKIAATKAGRTRQVIISKAAFDMFSAAKAARTLRGFDTAYVYGVALDYCVKSACLGLRRLGIETYLVQDATRAVARASGEAALALLRKKGVRFIGTQQLVRRLSPCRKKSDR